MMTDSEKRALHEQTITEHIKCVQDVCDHMKIHELGLEHDKSKFSPEEFEIYKWADGKQSPHDNARAELGVSPSWIYHKANNPHHWEFWTDYNSAKPNGDGTFTIICRPVKMPYDRVIEMFCDFIGAGKVYSKDAWTCQTPLKYWNDKCEGDRAMHADSEMLLKCLLTKLSECRTLEEFYAWYNKVSDRLHAAYDNNGAVDGR